MRSAITIVILSILFISMATYVAGDDAATIVTTGAISDGMTVRMVDVTPKSWLDYITAGSTAILAIFTGALLAATVVYVIRTGQNVKVSRELLDSNKELIELNKAQSDVTKAQLLCQVDELISNRRMGEGFPIDNDIGTSIRAYLARTAKDLLGEYYRKVRVKLRDDYHDNKPLFHIPTCKPGEPKVIPLIIWERLQEVDPDFEFIEYVDPE